MKTVLLFLAFLLIASATILWVRHGGGDVYPDLSKTPQFSANSLQEVLAYSESIGNVAVSRHGRIFFTAHFESRPQGNKLLEYVDGASSSLLQDLQVSADGRTIVIADAIFWKKSPALIIYDIEIDNTRRILEGHPSIAAENYVMQSGGRERS
jgi:hypothetical protein